MADTIWKFPLNLADDTFTIDMPRRSFGAPPKILSVDDREEGVVWAIVNPEAPLCMVKFTSVGTGEPLPSDIGDYVGTIVPSVLVWHIFARVVA